MLWFKNKRLEQLKQRINNKSRVKRYTSFVIGCLILSIAFNLFLAPNDIVSGGVSGIAIILNHLFTINRSIFMLITNLFLLVLSYHFLGKEKTRGSILGSLLFPILVQLTSNINSMLHMDNSDLLLSAIFAGVLYGFGSGMIFKAGFTTGGTDILNQIISKYFKIGMGNSILIVDGIIILFAGIIFGPTRVMYSIIVIYLLSFISDRVILGVSDSKAFYIITDEEARIKEYILKCLNHGVTVFHAKGGFKKEKETVLLCVLPTKDYYRLKEGIHEIDPDAFFVVTDAYEVFGGE